MTVVEGDTSAPREVVTDGVQRDTLFVVEKREPAGLHDQNRLPLGPTRHMAGPTKREGQAGQVKEVR